MYAVRDANLQKSKALPNGAATTTTDAIDLEISADGDLHARCELLLEAPALTTAELPDTQTVTYDVIHSDNADLSAPAVIGAAQIVQTGAAAAGAAAASVRFGLPSTVKRYVGMRQVKTGAANASAKSGTLSIVL